MAFFELGKCLLLLLLYPSCKLCVLGEQVVEWLCDATQVLDEIPVEACQAQHAAAHLALVCWWPHLVAGGSGFFVWLLMMT